jgi:hypothetical protein
VPLQRLAVVPDRTGRLDVFATGTSGEDQSVWQIQQTSPTSGWSAWTSAWWAWSPLGALALKHAPSGPSNAYWAVTTVGDLIHWNGSQWSTVTLPPPLEAAWVSVGSDGTVWVLASNGVLYQYVNAAF